MTAWRIAVPLLLVGAAVGAVVRSANASDLGRIGGLLAALALAGVGVGVYRGRRWASGASFFLGLFWLWAVLSLRIQGVMGSPEVFVWLGWSIAVMVGSVRTRSA